MQGMSGSVDAVYDITIGYDGGKILGLEDICLYNTGRHVHLHIRRFSIDSIPKEEEKMEKWLVDVWKQKEKLMDYFKEKGKFPNEYSLPLSIKSLNI